MAGAPRGRHLPSPARRPARCTGPAVTALATRYLSNIPRLCGGDRSLRAPARPSRAAAAAVDLQRREVEPAEARAGGSGVEGGVAGEHFMSSIRTCPPPPWPPPLPASAVWVNNNQYIYIYIDNVE